MTSDFLTEAFLALRGRWKSEDTLQDAFCRLWGGKYKVGSVKEAMGLLSRTGRNLEIDEYRKARGRRTVSIDGRQIEDEGSDAAEREALFRKVEASVDRVASLVEADSRNALDRKIDYFEGQMYYALLRLRADGSGENEYIGFQIKGIGKEKVTQDSAGNTVVGYELDENARGPFKQAYVTVVYLRGKATMNDLKKMFKQR